MGLFRCEGIDESGSALSWRARSRCLVDDVGLLGPRSAEIDSVGAHLLASAVLSSFPPVGVTEYHGWRSCFVGTRGTPPSESVIAGLDFEARAARAAACSSRSAKRLICP